MMMMIKKHICNIKQVVMKFIRSLITTWPVYLSVTLCLAGLGIAGWLISVLVRIQNDAKGYILGVGNRGAQWQLEMNVKLGVILLAINLCLTFINVVVFSCWRKTITMREMCVKAALIKQKEATEEAERKSTSKSIAVANASHEVRNALTGITGLIRMCRDDATPHSKLDHNLELMESCTNDLSGLLNSILDASKIEAGKMQVEEEEFDLQELLEDVVDFFYPLGMNKGVDVILDPCDESVEKFRLVRGDRGKLKQVLFNLLSNAIKFTDDGYVSLRVWARKLTSDTAKIPGGDSSIDLFGGCGPCFLFRKAETEQEQEEGLVVECDGNNSQRKDGVMEYIFKVVDTGKGIPKEKQKSVFENYAQVKENDGANKSKLGHGLGLAITQSLVRLMGGEVGIEDKEIGERGTCFRFNIFLESNSDSFFPYSSPTPKVKGLASSRVVVFIQSEERSKIIKKFFETRDVKVSVVSKGHQQLSRKLKKIKRVAFLPDSNSGGSGTTTPSYYSSSSSKSKDGIHSNNNNCMGGWDNNNNRLMVLIIIDTSVGAFQEVNEAIAEFYKDLQLGCAKVLWIDNVTTHNKDNHINLFSSDLVVSKPLQGAYLHHVLGLLPNFASTSQQGEIQVVIDKVKEEKEEKESGASTSNQKRALEGKRILVVEDHPIQRQICSSAVSKLGAITHTCYNGEEALELVSKALQNQHHQPPFDYILMDCEMPIMDGFEATKRIKEEGKAMGIWIPIIALTAHTEDEKEEMDRITKAGMDYYLPKPINDASLLRAIHNLDKSQNK